MLIPILSWYIALQFLALAGLPLAWATLKHLPSRGYGTAKALGLLLTGVIFWWGSSLQLWANTLSAVLTSAAIVVTAGLLLLRRQRRAAGTQGDVRTSATQWWQQHHRYVIAVEALFLSALIAWALVRASQPQIQTAGGEKWMEIAFLNAMLRSRTMPPQDPWLSGFTLSYYYLGYLLLGNLTRLTGIAPTIAFNLGNAGWFALAAVQAYSLVYDMSRDALQGRGALRALLAPLLLLITGNGEGILEVLHARGLLSPRFWAWMDIGRLAEPPQPPFSWIPQRFFWWWQASRTLRDRTPWGDIQEVIDEFPAFSFLLGDMHPHLLGLPFVLVAVALALNAYLGLAKRTTTAGADAVDAAADTDASSAPENGPRATFAEAWAARLRRARRRIQPQLATLIGYGAILGALGFLNTWDLPIYWALLVGAWVLGRYQRLERSFTSFFAAILQVVPEALIMGVLSVLLYLPFWFALRSQAGGILPNLFNATKLQQFIVMFLPLLPPIIGLTVEAGRRRSINWLRALGLGIGLMIAIAVLGLVVGLPSAAPYLRAIVLGEAVQGYHLDSNTAWTALRGRLLNPWTSLLLACGVGIVLTTIVEPPKAGRQRPTAAASADTFPLLLALIGLLLTLAPEFVYLQDVFVTRMNTIFKFYFQAWVLWSLAGAWQIGQWLSRADLPNGESSRSPVGRTLATGISLLCIALGLVYTALAVPARAREQGVPWTLDGAAWLRAAQPGDAAAIAWLNAHVEGAPVIVETPGDQHKAYVYEGRVSAFTGLPTVLGWGGHQRQWRGNYDEPAARETDLNLLMTTTDEVVTMAILRQYDVVYVYVGPTERQRYPESGLAKFAAMFPAVYEAQDVTIYQVTSDGAPGGPR